MKNFSRVIAMLLVLSMILTAIPAAFAAGDLTHVEAKAPTCTESGNKEYWKDADGNLFEDAEGQKKCYKNRVPKIDALGHNYGADGVCVDCGAVAANEGEIVIYYTNDAHCHIDEKDMNYRKVASMKEVTEQAVGETGGVLLVDAGDHVQGTPYGGMDKGVHIVNLMRMTGYDAATLGNHEFDYGMDRTMSIVADAAAEDGMGTAYPYLSCNFRHEKDGVPGDPVLDAYKIFTVGGKKIAIVGITTPESYTKSTPAYFQNEKGEYIYGIDGGKDGKALYNAVQVAIDAAKADGAEYVIGLAHTGVEDGTKPWRATDIIANTNGMDAYIDGHSHSYLPCEEVTNKDGDIVIYSQTGAHFKSLGKMVITDDGITAETVGIVRNTDQAVADYADAWMAEIEAKLGQDIALTPGGLFITDPDTGLRMIRSQETNLGNFTTDALRYYFTAIDPVEKNSEGVDYAFPDTKGVDFAVMNGGGIRDDVKPGAISAKTCNKVHTFGNMATVIELSGQKVLDALEWGARQVGKDENGGFLQVSGLTYEIDTSVADGCQKDEKGNWVAHTGEYRVKKVMVQGQPLQLEKIYTMAGQGYTLKSGGDGYTMFKGCPYPKDEKMIDFEVLADYAKSFPMAADAGYKDVSENVWYENYVNAVTEAKLMTGVAEGVFAPDSCFTRGQAVTVLYRLAGSPAITDEMEANCTFTDLEEGRYYVNAVKWAADKDITNGRTATTFAPNACMTRQELVTMLYRCTDGEAEGADLSGFKDAEKVYPFAEKAMKWAVETGIIEGTTYGDSEDLFLNPVGKVTRAENAKVFSVLCNLRYLPTIGKGGPLVPEYDYVDPYGEGRITIWQEA